MVLAKRTDGAWKFAYVLDPSHINGEAVASFKLVLGKTTDVAGGIMRKKVYPTNKDERIWKLVHTAAACIMRSMEGGGDLPGDHLENAEGRGDEEPMDTSWQEVLSALGSAGASMEGGGVLPGDQPRTAGELGYTLQQEHPSALGSATASSSRHNAATRPPGGGAAGKRDGNETGAGGSTFCSIIHSFIRHPYMI
jgi:hypothetical protein